MSDLPPAMRWYLLRGGGRRGVSYGGVARAAHILKYLYLIYTLCMFYVTMNICMFDVLYLCMFYVQTPLILQGVSACWLEGRLDGLRGYSFDVSRVLSVYAMMNKTHCCALVSVSLV